LFGSAYYAMKGFGMYSNKNNNEFSGKKDEAVSFPTLKKAAKK